MEEAVVRIGQKRVGQLALAANALSAVTPKALPWFDLDIEWKRSMAAGIAIEALVELGGHHDIADGLLLSAIMYPLGRIGLASLFPDQYEEMIRRCAQSGESLREQERRVFPTSHTEIMAQLLATWRIPPDVSLPLKYALDDFATFARLPEPNRTRTELVTTAVLLGRVAVRRWNNWNLVQLPPARVLKRLRITNVCDIVHQIRSDLDKLADFNPAGRSTRDYPETLLPETDVAYCNLSKRSDDLFVESLPAMRIHPMPVAVDELRYLGTSSIVNCLGASSAELPGSDDWHNAVFITDDDHRELFEPLGRTFTLPNSFGRLLHAVGEWTTMPSAAQLDEPSPVLV